jgi:hypothetical protein
VSGSSSHNFFSKSNRTQAAQQFIELSEKEVNAVMSSFNKDIDTAVVVPSPSNPHNPQTPLTETSIIHSSTNS